MNRACAVLVVMFGLTTLVGCEVDTGPAAMTYRTIVIDDATPDEVLQAGELVLAREFRAVTTNRAARTIVSAPVEYTTRRESGTTRDFYRGRSRMRRVARFASESLGGQTVARLRIDIERQDTARRTALRSATGRIDDSPARTPIEDDGATTESQNQVWTKVRRDVGVEQRLLAELRRAFAPPVTGEISEAPAGQPDNE